MRGPGEPRTVFNASDPIPTEYDADELADPLDTQGVMMVKPDGRVWRVGSHTAYKLQKRFGLTYRRALFCMEYMRDLNPPAAALRAGFAPRTASAAARIVLRCPKVMDCITLLQTELCKAIDMDPTWIVEQLKMQVFKHLQMAGAEPLSREGFAVFERFGKHLGLFRDNVDLTLTADKGLKSVTVRFINPDGTEYDDRAAPADAAPHSTRQH